MSDDGLEKSAILLLSLGEEEASEVLKYLGPKEVQKLGTTMANLGSINHGRLASVLHDFRQEAEGQAGLGGDTDAYLRSVLTKALGNDKAASLLERILQGGDNSGIESLKWMDAGSIAELIRNEHPQIIATILVHLDRDHAADILKLFTERLRNDVMLRIASLEGAQPIAMKELNEVLAKILTGGEAVKKTSLGGVRTTAEILNYMGGAIEDAVLGAVKDYDADLAQKIQDQNVHIRQSHGPGRQGNPAPAAGNPVRVAHHRAQGYQRRTAGENIQEHVQPRGRDAPGGSRGEGAGASG